MIMTDSVDLHVSGSMKLSINIDELDECGATEGEDINCSFSIKYIHIFI